MTNHDLVIRNTSTWLAPLVTIGLVMCGTAVGSKSPAAEFDLNVLRQALDPLLKNHDGEVAVMLKHSPSGTTYSFNADQPMGTASLIKLPVLMALYQAVADEKVALDDSITLTADDQVPGSGILTANFSPGLKLSVRDAAHLMIVYSDNAATNLVIDQIGLDATNGLMKSLGCTETRLNSKVFRRDTSNDLARSQEYGLGSTSASEMVRLVELLYEGSFVSPAVSDKVLDHLFACDDRSKVPRHLPDAIRVAHKTGAVNDIRTDAGLIELGGEDALLYCVLTSNNADRSWGNDNASELLAAEVGRIGFEFFSTGAATTPPLAVLTLQMGSSGEIVEALQRTLNGRLKPSPGIATDGDFGPNTEAAVRAFQRQAHLADDGIVDREFWTALGPLMSAEDSLVAADEAAAKSESAKRHPPEDLLGPPLTTAKAWIVCDRDSGERLSGYEDQARRDPASTTKIMTAYLVIKLAEQQPDILDEVITFSQQADETTGSTSGLRAGEQVTVGELLYGLLLPSGNDAAYAIADYLGGRVAGKERGDGYPDFIDAMNAMAKQLDMEQTGYRNPHGLTAKGHHTTAADLARLAHAALQLPRFREVVSTRRRVTRIGSQSGYVRDVVWTNTNQLLNREGYIGVKTGTTGPAGACLVSCGERDGRGLIVVVLGSSSSDARYVDTRNLYRWAWNQMAEDEPFAVSQP